MPINDIITSLRVVGQFPLDPKLTFKLLADMQNLGTNNINTFTYYESMLVICIETQKQYIWRSPVVINETGVLASSYTYPANTVSDGIDYSNRVFNFFEYTVNSNNIPVDQADIIYDGTVYWLQNLDYRSTPITYRISNNNYVAPITNLTLAPAHATLNRRDIFVVNTSNQIVIITGTPAVNPQEPVINIGSQLKVSSVYIPATATQPQGVANALIYNENLGTPTEWAATYDGSIPATIDLASTTSPSDGTVSIETTNVDVVNILRFDAAALVTVQGLSSIQFKIKHKTTQDYILDIVLKRDTIVVSTISLNTGDYVFNPADNSAYQVINIPASVLNLTVADIDFIGFNVNGGSGTIGGFFLDYIQLMYGSENPTVEGTYLGLNDTFDTTFIGKKGYTPIINDTETGLDLKRAVKLTDIYSNNQLINYSYVWTTGLTFEVTVVGYIMNGVLLPTNGTILKTVTLAVADITNPRKDIIVVNEDETISVLQGTPAINPAEPTVDYLTQLVITVVDIPANAIVPQGTSEELIYDENIGEPNEWTVTESTGGARFDLANIGNPFSGTKAIKGTLVQGGDILTFTNNSNVLTDSLNSLNFRLNMSFNSNLVLVIRMFKNGVGVSIPLLRLTDGLYGFDQSIINTYQNIVIPSSVFNFTDVAFDTIQIGFKVTGGGTINIVYVDKVRLVYGGGAIIIGDAFTGLIDTPDNYAGKASQLVKVKPDESGVEFIENKTSKIINDGSDGINPYITALDATELNTFFIDSISGNDVTGEYQNSSKPFATINAAIDAYIALVIPDESDVSYLPIVIYNIVDTSTQIITKRLNRVLGGIPSAFDKPFVTIKSNGNIVFENNTGTVFYPLSIDDTALNTDHGRIDIITNGNLIFQGTGVITLGRVINNFRTIINIKANECIFGLSTHTIIGIGETNNTVALLYQGASTIKFNKTTVVGGTHFNYISGKSVVDLGEIVINTSSTVSIIGLVYKGAIVKFNKITASQSFVFYKASGYQEVNRLIIEHGDIEGSYAGIAFPYITSNIVTINYKDDCIISLPCWIDRVFNAACEIYLKGNIVTYSNNTPTHFLGAQTSGSVDVSTNIGMQIDIRHLIIPNRLVEVIRSGSGFRLINCTLELGGKITEGFIDAVDVTAYELRSANPNRLLEIIGDCTIISGIADGTSILSNTLQANASNAECLIKGNLQLISGVIDETSVDTITPIGTVTKYSNNIKILPPFNLTAAQINAIGTTSITVIPAPGVGKAIRIIDFAGKLNFGTVAFDNNILQIEPIGGTGNHQYYISNLINGVVSTIRTGQPYYIDDNIRENEAMVIDGIDSVAVGDGTVDLYITYEIITL